MGPWQRSGEAAPASRGRARIRSTTSALGGRRSSSHSGPAAAAWARCAGRGRHDAIPRGGEEGGAHFLRHACGRTRRPGASLAGDGGKSVRRSCSHGSRRWLCRWSAARGRGLACKHSRSRVPGCRAWHGPESRERLQRVDAAHALRLASLAVHRGRDLQCRRAQVGVGPVDWAPGTTCQERLAATRVTVLARQDELLEGGEGVGAREGGGVQAKRRDQVLGGPRAWKAMPSRARIASTSATRGAACRRRSGSAQSSAAVRREEGREE
mmetsp:Transcript_7386/g.20108  ORF Transcript_7386/g.20108 Transcript_7386/m.20108 type:complete len:268 (+) Transcript_7386:433-1236(+)